MKKLLIALSTVALYGCIGDDVSGNDTQTVSISNNGIANISITANGCKGISANGGTCTVNVIYSAPNGSGAIGSGLSIGGLNGYNSAYQCGNFTTTQQSCIIVITSIGSTSNVQHALIYPNSYSNTNVSFIVGGGV